MYLRERRRRYRRLAERIRLYKEARRLEASGLSHSRISKILGLGSGQISYWLVRGAPPHYERYDPDLTPGPELAYLVGFWLGDGRNAGREKKVRFKLADEWQINYVSRLVARLLDREAKAIVNERPFYVVDYDTSILYDYLSQPVEKLIGCIQPFKADFLRGFFDAEGYVSCSVDTVRRRLGPPVIGAANTNIRYLRLVRKLLAAFIIKTSIRTTNKKGGMMTIRGRTWVRRRDVHHVVISERESGERFYKHVRFKNRLKQQKLDDLVSLLPLSPRERYDWFVIHYIKRGRRWLKIAQ